MPEPLVIFFDAVGTLIHPHPDVEDTYARFGQRWGSRLGSELIGPRFRAAFRRQEEWDRTHGYRTGEPRERERWQTIVAEVFDDVPDSAGLFAELWDSFAQPNAWTCYPDVIHCLQWLRELKLIWGIASNYDHRLRPVVAGLPALRDCRYLAISSEIGWRKPATEFFAALPAIVGLPSANLTLVGNDEANDLRGGQAAHLRVVLLARQASSAATPAIATLDELPHWLKESGAIP